MNEIEIVDLYGYKDYKYLDEIIGNTLNMLNVSNVIFSIILTDDKKIRSLNKKYRGIDSTTDVLSFALEDKQDIIINEVRILGDVYISIPRMRKQAIEYNHSEKRELSFLSVHGILHLLGYDHQTKEEENIMFELQDKILGDRYENR